MYIVSKEGSIFKTIKIIERLLSLERHIIPITIELEKKQHKGISAQYLDYAELIPQPNTNVELNYCQRDHSADSCFISSLKRENLQDLCANGIVVISKRSSLS